MTGIPDPSAYVEVLNMGEAVPITRHVTTLRRFRSLRNGTGYSVLAVTASGDVVGRISPNPLSQHRIETRVALISATSAPDAGPTFSAPESSRPQQAFAADANNRFVVWMETPSAAMNVLPWTLYARDRSGHVHELATSAELDGQAPPPPPGHTGPVLAGDRVFWAQVSGRPGAERVDVYGCRVTNCRPRVFVKGAAFPAATREALYVIAAERFRAATSSAHLTVKRVDLGSGRVTEVARTRLGARQEPSGLGATEGHVAWVVAGEGTDILTILDRATGSRTIARSEKGGGFGHPVVTTRLVTWAESSGVSTADVGGYAYDLQNEELYSVGNTAGLYSINAAGDVIAWQQSTAPAARLQDVVNVIGRVR